jgi:hypothetical protein
MNVFPEWIIGCNKIDWVELAKRFRFGCNKIDLVELAKSFGLAAIR